MSSQENEMLIRFLFCSFYFYSELSHRRWSRAKWTNKNMLTLNRPQANTCGTFGPNALIICIRSFSTGVNVFQANVECWYFFWSICRRFCWQYIRLLFCLLRLFPSVMSIRRNLTACEKVGNMLTEAFCRGFDSFYSNHFFLWIINYKLRAHSPRKLK